MPSFALLPAILRGLPANSLLKKHENKKADLNKITFIGLDEWVGIPPENEGSCHYFFQHEF